MAALALHFAAGFSVFAVPGIGLSPDSLLELLRQSLPLREIYEPTPLGMLLTYAWPVAVGAIVGIATRAGKLGYGLEGVPERAIALSLGAMAFLMLKADARGLAPSQLLAVLEYGVLLPALFGLGLVVWVIRGRPMYLRPETERGTARGCVVVIATLSAALMVINLSQPLSYEFPWGADTYSQIARDRTIEQGRGVFQDSHFFEESNAYYPPGGSYLSLAVGWVSGAELVEVWQVLPVLTTAATLLAILLAVRRFGSGAFGLTITGLLILGWREILLVDASQRHIAFLPVSVVVLLLAISQKRSVGQLAALSVLSVGALFAHLSAGVFVLFLVLGLMVLNRLPSMEMTSRQHPGSSSHRTLYIGASTAVAYLAILCFLFVTLAAHGDTSPFIVSEAAVGASIPYPFPSFLMAALLPIAFVVLVRNKSNLRVPALMAAPFGLLLFYFSKIWVLFHKYFLEIGSWGLAAFAALFAQSAVRDRTFRLLVIIALIASLSIAVEPRISQVQTLSESREDQIQLRSGVLSTIETLDSNAVVLVHPDEILNRYIPPFTGRFIFCATNELDPNRPFQIVSKPLSMLPRIHERNELARAFYASPTNDTLGAITSDYRVDAIVFPTRSVPENTTSMDLVLMRSDSQYSLFAIAER